MSVLIPLDELELKYDVIQYNDKSIKYVIKKEFPEFDDLIPQWKIEDRFLKVDFLDKEQIEELKAEEKSYEMIKKSLQYSFPQDIKDECKKRGISEEVAIELQLEAIKEKFGGYSKTIEAFQEYMIEDNLNSNIDKLIVSVSRLTDKLKGESYKLLFDKLSKDFLIVAPKNFGNAPKKLKDIIIKVVCDTIVLEGRDKFGSFKECLNNYDHLLENLKEKIANANSKFYQMMGREY